MKAVIEPEWEALKGVDWKQKLFVPSSLWTGCPSATTSCTPRAAPSSHLRRQQRHRLPMDARRATTSSASSFSTPAAHGQRARGRRADQAVHQPQACAAPRAPGGHPPRLALPPADAAPAAPPPRPRAGCRRAGGRHRHRSRATGALLLSCRPGRRRSHPRERNLLDAPSRAWRRAAVFPGGPSLRILDAARSFAATAVVAPSGYGLLNILYCESGTHLHDAHHRRRLARGADFAPPPVPHRPCGRRQRPGGDERQRRGGDAAADRQFRTWRRRRACR